MPSISNGFRSISEHPNSTCYKINPIMSFSEWINQLELDSRYSSLGAQLPRHRGMLIACVTSWLLTIANSDDLGDIVLPSGRIVSPQTPANIIRCGTCGLIPEM
ncbi:hypothetical protein ASPBRDRAFT_28293 [Aspergillus brasiliensis CBS 101740]|uniref:Uncharacterized protein n=1 Tax=Aspergillus brasiliensis (strain CBS 101740 / IMI 381727 / IBT 21946) TaxID=767769 RepID=A0A1L9UUE1_ASPBC|nr:hypothetical protein ASPBRDRAFT_28293 [Aspergillus brasiliensis CBS 101740]